MANSEYNLTVVDGTALTVSLSGPVGPAGAGGGSSTISTSTPTTLTGYIYGNGTTIAGATAATSANTANTLVLRNATGGAAFNSSVTVGNLILKGLEVGEVDTLLVGANVGIGITSSLISATYINVPSTPLANALLNFNGVTNDRTYTFPNVSGTVALTDVAQTFSGAQTFTNASIKLSNIPEYANNSTASLPNGSIYRTSTGELRIKIP